MLIEKIQEKAEESLCQLIKTAHETGTGWGVIEMDFSHCVRKPETDALLLSLKNALEEAVAAKAFFLGNGDVCIAWKGRQAAIRDKLQQAYQVLLMGYAIPGKTGSAKYHDVIADGQALYLAMKKRLGEVNAVFVASALATSAIAERQAVATRTSYSADFLANAKQKFMKAEPLRKQRRLPEILVVEDQSFSRKLLIEILKKQYETQGAGDGLEALSLYATRAPDILFLDIELPDIKGHEIARAIRLFDKNPFIVLVTANNYVDDVKAAREYGAMGFIVKPFNKQKILDSVAKYLTLKLNK